MESEKVKEIKDKLKAEISIAENYEFEYRSLKLNCLQDILTLINELESENERLNKSDTSKEESSIEYYNLYKDLKRKNKNLNELCELQRVSIAESFVRENQLKDRIAELEKENAKLNIELDKRDCIDYPCRLIEKEHLKQFAENVLKFVKYVMSH